MPWSQFYAARTAKPVKLLETVLLNLGVLISTLWKLWFIKYFGNKLSKWSCVAKPDCQVLRVVLSNQCSGLDIQIFHQPPDPNVPLLQPQSRPGSRRSRAICLSTGSSKPRSLYTPTLCLADAESEYWSDYHHRSSHHNFPKLACGL